MDNRAYTVSIELLFEKHSLYLYLDYLSIKVLILTNQKPDVNNFNT